MFSEIGNCRVPAPRGACLVTSRPVPSLVAASTAARVLKLVSLLCLGTILFGCGGHSGATPNVSTPPSATLASITLSGPLAARTVNASPILVLAPGTNGVLTAQALDANGNPVTAAISWTSSDPTVATVSDGKVTAVSLGHVQITASSGSVTSNSGSVIVNPSQSATSAIARAVAAGTLSAEQGMVYRVFALFKDPGLPAAYLSTTDHDPDTHDMDVADVANGFDSLSPQSQDLIGPYLVPPAYWGTSTSTPSRAGVKQAVHTYSQPRPGYCHYSIGSDWKAVSKTNFNVFYKSSSDPKQAAAVAALAQSAQQVLDIAEQSFSKLVGAAGFNKPLPDTGYWACDGGDALLDIYIMDYDLDCEAVTVPLTSMSSGSPSPAYILLSPRVLKQPDLNATVTHEFMHAIQYGYTNLGRRSYFWTGDATAEWAVDYVWDSPLDPDPPSYVGYFLDKVDRPLFYPNGYCEYESVDCDPDNDDRKMYGAYVFFQFMTKEAAGSGASIVSAFFNDAAAFDDSLGAVNYALLGQGGLTQVWPQFALWLWNQDPVNGSFAGWDGATEWDSNTISSTDPGTASPPYTILSPAKSTNGSANPVVVDELSAVYEQYEFGPAVHSIVFYNGYVTKLSQRDAVIGAYVSQGTNQTLDGGNLFVNFAATDDEVKGRHIWAIKKIGDTWQTPEDWTTPAFQPICLDAADQRVQSLVLIYSNGNYSATRSSNWDDSAADALGDQKSTLVASTTPCWKYQGATRTTYTYNDGTDNFTIHAASTGTFVGEPSYAQGDVAGGNAVAFNGWLFKADPTSLLFSADVYGIISSCSAGYPISVQTKQGAEHWAVLPQIHSWGYPAGSAAFNAYTSESDDAIQYVVNGCTGGGTKTLPAIGAINFNLNFTAFQTLTSDGLLTSGSGGLEGPVWTNGDYSDPGTASYTWCLAPLRENPDSPPPDCP